MTIDATKPLAPLDLDTRTHLTATLGPSKPHFVGISEGRDIHTAGWTIGLGQIGVGGNPTRGTDVEILLTEGGRLITTRRSWTRGADGVDTVSQTGCVHETPAAAYQWLVNDGKGKLGPASKTAWVQACRAVPLMAGLEFERVD